MSILSGYLKTLDLCREALPTGTDPVHFKHLERTRHLLTRVIADDEHGSYLIELPPLPAPAIRSTISEQETHRSNVFDRKGGV